MANEQPTTQLDPQSVVARIISELQASPEAQRLLLRALLTNEFLGMPARLDHIEKDVAQLKIDVAQLKTDVRQLKNDVGYLKGSDLEMKVHRRIVPLVSQDMRLRRVRVIKSALQQATVEFDEPLAQAADDGRHPSRAGAPDPRDGPDPARRAAGRPEADLDRRGGGQSNRRPGHRPQP